MKPDVEALERLIASLPDPDDDDQTSGMGFDELEYTKGLRDALRILSGKPAKSPLK